MELNLNVKDRLTLIAILPTSGKITDLVEVMEIIKKIKFDKEEKEQIQYKEEDGKIQWNTELEIDKNLDFSFEQVGVIKNAIKKLDDEGKITLAILDTCLKFNKL